MHLSRIWLSVIKMPFWKNAIPLYKIGLMVTIALAVIAYVRALFVPRHKLAVRTENSGGLCYQLFKELDVTLLNGSLWATTGSGLNPMKPYIRLSTSMGEGASS
jgi:hypothetical protein